MRSWVLRHRGVFSCRRTSLHLPSPTRAYSKGALYPADKLIKVFQRTLPVDDVPTAREES